jgi:hypothetical protein
MADTGSSEGYARDDRRTVAERHNDEADQKIIARAKKRFELAVSAEAENRNEALSDLKFMVSDQWDPGIKARRNAEMRPCLTINKLPTFVHQVTNDQRQNRPALHVAPLGAVAAKKTALMIQGYIRARERASDAEIAYDTGFHNAASNGFGYWRLITEYERFAPGVGINDQVISWRRVRNPFTVYMDVSRQQPEGSDAMWAHVTEMVPRDEFKEAWPDADQLSWELNGTGDNYKNWITDKSIRICEYFEIEMETRTLVALNDGHVGYEDDLADSIKADIKADPEIGEGHRVVAKREEECRKVMWYKITAAQILEREELPGRWIPIIECVGDETDVEGRVVKSGIVRNAKGPQQMYNYTATANVEAVALQPKVPYVMAEGQDEGFEDEWNTANTNAYSRLRYKMKALNGALAPPPQRQPPPQLSPGWVELQQNAAQDMMAVTGIRFDSTLQERTQDESGIALSRLASHQQLGSFHYIDNFRRSLTHTGRIVLDWLPIIMDTRRHVTIVQDDGSDKHVIIDPTAPQAYQLEKGDDGKSVEVYNLTLGQYEVTATIGPNFATRQQESSTGMMEFGKAFPNKADLIADLVAKNQPWQDSDEIAKRIAMTLPPGMIEPDESDLSPQVQALINSQNQQIQKLTQFAQQAQAALADQQQDRAITQQKNEQDFEAKILAIVEKAQTAAADRQEAREANILTHLRAELDAIRALSVPAHSPGERGNGAMKNG